MNLGAFAQGFAGGMNMGRQWKKWNEEDQLKQLQAEEFGKVGQSANYGEAMGLAEGQQAEMLKAQDAEFGDAGYKATAEGLNSVSADTTQADPAKMRAVTESDAMNSYARNAQAKGLMTPMEAMKLRREAKQDEFANEQMAEAKRKNQMERGLADAKKYFSEQIDSASQFAQGIRGIGGLRGLQDAVKESGGTLTPEAMRLYRQAMYEARPENAISNATSKLRAYDPVGANTLTSSMLKQAKDAMLGEAGRFVQAGDFEGLAGFVSDNSNYSDGFEYKYLGALPNGKLRFAQVADGGKVIGTQDFGDKAEVLAYMQSTIDPEKAVAYWDKKKDNERADRNASITAGSAALNNRLAGIKIAEAEKQAERDNAIHDLRVTLSNTTDPEQRKAIQQRITDLVSVKADNDLKRFSYVKATNSAGQEVTLKVDAVTGDETVVDIPAKPIPVKEKRSFFGFGGGDKKATEGMQVLPPPVQKPFAAKDRQPDQSGLPEGAKHIGYSKGKAVYELPDGSRIVEQ